MAKGKVKRPLNDKEIKFAHFMMTGDMTDRQAAEKAGIPASSADNVKAKPEVQDYMAAYRDGVRNALAKHEAKVLVKFDITPDQLLLRLWQIAKMGAQETNGTMHAQVSAVKELLDRAEKKPAAHEDGEPKGPKIYQPAWMREQENVQ